MNCTCGMDLLNPSGNQHDEARCTRCTWAAGGAFAEHAGYHHYLDTGHAWNLTVYTTERNS